MVKVSASLLSIRDKLKETTIEFNDLDIDLRNIEIMEENWYAPDSFAIIDENGENFIKLNGNVNTSSYSEMKKSYHKAKMKNKDRNWK